MAALAAAMASSLAGQTPWPAHHSPALDLGAALPVPLAAAAGAGADFDSQVEQEALRLVNGERARRGLNTLELDTRLSQVAREHCRRMARTHSAEHQYPGEPDLVHRVQASGVGFSRVSENLAMGTEGISGAHAMMMQSPRHHDNILAPDFNAIGIAALWSGGVLYVTEVFVQR